MAERLPVRRPQRLSGFDYSWPGMYLVTICTAARACVFGEVCSEVMRLSASGEVARDAWLDLANHHDGVLADAFVVMPNHVHGIVDLTSRPERTRRGRGRTAAGVVLSTVVGGYKSSVARRINVLRGTPAGVVWQRGFHDRVIRDDDELLRIRRYIAENPMKWHLDRENPLLWRRR